MKTTTIETASGHFHLLSGSIPIKRKNKAIMLNPAYNII
jgi:hypothetical protein